MENQEKKTLSFILLLLVTMMFFLIFAQWSEVNRILNSGFLSTINEKIGGHTGFLIRFLYCILLILSGFLMPKKTRKKNLEYMWIWIMSMFLSGGILVLGFSNISAYNLIIFPIIFLVFTFLAIYVMMHITANKLKDDDSIFGCTNEKSDFYFSFPTEEGTLTIHKPQQNIYIDGGPGSGKSVSFIKPMIQQCAMRNYGGFIYDWEGDPMKVGSPILSRVAYACIKEETEKGNCNLNFGFINFTDMMKTVRVNVLSEKYVPKDNPGLFIDNLASTLMKNLVPEWKEKTDFWANNAIMFVSSVALKCYRDRHLGINTLAHVIAFCLSDSNLVFDWLANDKEITLKMSSMFSAHSMGASQQTAGAVSSAQTPMTKLLNKYIFWVLSPSSEEEFSLDITNPENPTLLCVGNAPNIKDAVSPAISCICSVIMDQMNNPGKIRGSVFMVDEFPTVNLQGIDVFIGTARKHHVSTILALQDFNQAVRDYGEKSAKILKAASGTHAYGMTGNDSTAEAIEKLFGEMKEVQESFSEQDSGGGSRSESLQKDKVLKARDVAGQGAGHFVGKIANGKPPYFNLQFKETNVPDCEIPDFAKRVNTGDPKVDREIQEGIVEQNYNDILAQVEGILKANFVN